MHEGMCEGFTSSAKEIEPQGEQEFEEQMLALIRSIFSMKKCKNLSNSSVEGAKDTVLDRLRIELILSNNTFDLCEFPLILE